MKVLIVTGTKAKNIVEGHVKGVWRGVDVEVTALPVQVAALITPQYAAQKLGEMKPCGFDLVLLPGMVRGDVGEVAKSVGIPAFKGPKHSVNLPQLLENLGSFTLSTVKPACELYRDLVRHRVYEELNIVKKAALTLEAGGVGFTIGHGKAKMWTHEGYSPLLVAEVVDASQLPDDAIAEKAAYYAKCGADVIDLGMEAGGGHAEDATRAVKAAANAVSKPLSIDSNDVEEFEAAVGAGVNLVMSINLQNMEAAARFASQVPAVVTPAGADGTIPETASERVNQLEENSRKAHSLGFTQLVADPLLSPPPTSTLLDSLRGYIEFRKRNPNTPLLLGAGNITEFADVDSVGLNFLLAHLSWELGPSLIFTTEASNKTRGSVREISTALKMLTLAQRMGKPPKDLGLDLLELKEKRVKRDVLDPAEEAEVPELSSFRGRGYTHDPKGFFKVKLNRKRKEMLLFHYPRGWDKPDFKVRGQNPVSIYRAVVREGLISQLDHAAYLGSELEKANTALLTRRSYVQDVYGPFGSED